MTGCRCVSGARFSHGASLIELMVSMAIGLIITVAVLYAYQGASSANKMAEAQMRMNEDAQAALIILTQQLRMAGNNPEQANRVDNVDSRLSSRRNPVYSPMPTYAGFVLLPASFAVSSFSLRGCDGTFTNLKTATDIDHLTCTAGASTLPDSIAVSYESDKFNTVPTSGNLPTDCVGRAPAAITATLPAVSGAVIATTDVAYVMADNRFYIDTWAAVPSLYCKGNGTDSTPQSLVENIEDMQLVYGATAATTTIAGYLSADQILANATLAHLANDALRWEKVISVRICVVARSQYPVVSSALSARYVKCDGSLETAPPDLRLRHAYSTTVVLRNRRL
jgi:type IV pilus assembly protein PilW